VIVWGRLAELVREHGAAALVSVHEVQGSAPRDVGARMVVRPDGAFHGTIGGGQLEWQMLAAARSELSRGRGPALFLDQALGPDLGQCCGGRVRVLVETFARQDLEALEDLARMEADGICELVCRLQTDGRVARRRSPAEGQKTWRETYGLVRTPLLLFGAGHVGRALVLALAPLPFEVRWIDTREGAFPAHLPATLQSVQTSDPLAELDRAPADAFVLVMTHEHPLDLAITAAALQRGFPFVGLIGSATKRARFEKRFRELRIPDDRIRGLHCPIGVPGIAGKEPAVIAASTTAQLLAERERLSALTSRPSSPLRVAGRGGGR
jgi:xanthine dehydrogenase accessory factor